MSRLVYRKGIDLLVKVIPKVCDSYPKVITIEIKFKIPG